MGAILLKTIQTLKVQVFAEGVTKSCIGGMLLIRNLLTLSERILVHKFSSRVKLPETIEHPWVHLLDGCPCSEEQGEQEQHPSASGVQVENPPAGRDQQEDCTPSKLQRLSLTPMVSPSDVLSLRDTRKNVKVKSSIKFEYTKAKEDDLSGLIVEAAQVV